MKIKLLFIFSTITVSTNWCFSQNELDTAIIENAPSVTVGVYPTYLIPNRSRSSRYDNESLSGFISLDLVKLFSLVLRIDKGTSFISGYNLETERQVFTKYPGIDYTYAKYDNSHMLFPDLVDSDLKLIDYKVSLDLMFNIITVNKFGFYAGLGFGIGQQERYDYSVVDAARYETNYNWLAQDYITSQVGSDSVMCTRTYYADGFYSTEWFLGIKYNKNRWLFNIDLNLSRVRFENYEQYGEINNDGSIHSSQDTEIKKGMYYLALGIAYKLIQ